MPEMLKSAAGCQNFGSGFTLTRALASERARAGLGPAAALAGRGVDSFLGSLFAVVYPRKSIRTVRPYA